MNKIYKVVWNAVRGCYVVASELASSRKGKKSIKCSHPGTRAIFALMVAAMLSAGGFGGVNTAFADEPAHSNTMDHQYVVLSAGGNLDGVKSAPYIMIDANNNLVYGSATANANNVYKGNGITGTGNNNANPTGTRNQDGTITGGDTVYLNGKQYTITNYTTGGVYTLTAVDGSGTTQVYRYSKSTLRDYAGNIANYSSNRDNGYRIREGYTVTASQGQKFTPISNTDNVFTVTYTGNANDRPSDILTKITSVNSLSGTTTNIGEDLQTVKADQYTSQATGGAQVGGNWDYVVSDPNESSGFKNLKGSSMPQRFVQTSTGTGDGLHWNDATQQYNYTYTHRVGNQNVATTVPVATDNLYVIDGKMGVFKNADNTLYTGTVYGSGNEVLLTSLVDGKYYSFWGAQSNDTAQTMQTYPLQKYNQDIATLTDNDTKLAHNDIHSVKTTTTANSATIGVYRNGTDMKGTTAVAGAVTITGNGASGGIGGNNTSITLTGTNGNTNTTQTYNTGSVVGQASDLVNGTRNLQKLTINGTQYNLQLGFQGDTGSVITKDLGNTLSITGGATSNLTRGNIGVVNNNGALNIGLKKDVDLGSDGSLKTGTTTINSNGLTITGGPSVTLTGGVNAGGQQVTNVASGGSTTTNAANIGDVHTIVKADIQPRGSTNITVTSTNGTGTDANVRYDTVSLNNRILLGDTAQNTGMTIDGTAGTITMGINDGKQITLNSTTGQSNVAGVKSGNFTATDALTSKTYTSTDEKTYGINKNVNPEAPYSYKETTLLNGAAGSAQTGTFVTGLTNTDWDWRNLSIVSGRAATEDEVLKAGQHFFSINPRQGVTDLSTIPNYYNDGAQATASIAIGHGVSTKPTATGSIAIGANGTSTGRATTTGTGSSATTTYSGGNFALAVGNEAKAEGDESMAIGHQADAAGDRSLSIGNNNYANGIRSIAIGVNVQSGYANSYADVNNDSYSSGKMIGGANIALGNRTRVNGTGSTALGFGATVGKVNSDGTMNLSEGADLAVALGGRTEVTQDGGVALGNTSVSNRAAGSYNAYMSDHATVTDANGNVKEDQATIDAARSNSSMGSLKATYTRDAQGNITGATENKLENGTAWRSNMGAVSIGSDTARTAVGGDSVPVITRQLTGLAAGTEDTDAVNVAQLKALSAAGLNFVGENKEADDSLVKVHTNQGDTLAVQGAANVKDTTTPLTTNIYVAADKDGQKLNISLKDDINVHTVTAGTAGNGGRTGTVSIVGNNASEGSAANYVAYNINSGRGSSDLNSHTDRLTYTDGTDTHTLATLDDGLRFKGDDASTTSTANHVVRKLMDQDMTITGGANTGNLSDNNIGVVSTENNDGLVVKLAKDITGLNTIRVGKNSDTNGGIYIGTQNDGTKTTTGNYITGLENTEWDIKNPSPVSGRAATEDQLKTATGDVLKAAGNNTYVTSASATYGDNGKGMLTLNRNIDTLSENGTTSTTRDSLTTDIHDYYVTSGEVTNDNHIKLSRNGDLGDIDLDLSKFVTSDYRLVGAAVANEGTTSYTGSYTPVNGSITLNVQDQKDPSKVETITLTGLSTNFGANVAGTGAASNSHTVNLGGTQNILGSDTTAKTGATYSNGNIHTQLNSNGDIVINLNDDPTLKSLILQGETSGGTTPTITLDKGTGDNANRISYTVSGSDTVFNVATIQDGYTLLGDNYNGSLPNGAYTSLNKNINITGGAKSTGTNGAGLADANNIGTTVSQDENGNTTYNLKLAKNVTGLTSVAAGGEGTDAVSPSTTDAAMMGRQTGLTVTTVKDDGSIDTTSKEMAIGDYVTGLDNKNWTVGQNTYVSGRAATEDQLKTVSDQVGKNTTNISNNTTKINAGWNAVVKNGTTTTTTTDGKTTETRSDTTINVNPDADKNTLNFAEGDNIRLSGDNRTVTIKTNPVVGFDTVKVAGTGSGGSMTGGIEIGSQTPTRTVHGYSETTMDEGTGANRGYTVKTYTLDSSTPSTDGSYKLNWTAVHYDSDGQRSANQPTGDNLSGSITVRGTDTTGKYATGLSNTDWNNGYYVSGRAATEDQLAQVATQIRGEAAAGDTYVTKGTISYHDGTGTTTDDGSGKLVLEKNNDTTKIADITGLHDYYVVSGQVLKPNTTDNTSDHSVLRLTKNGAATGNNYVDIDLSALATTDWRLVANPAEGSNGVYTPVDGKMTLTMQDMDDKTKTETITLDGLNGYFGADNTSSTTTDGNTTWTNRITRNAGQQLDIKGGDNGKNKTNQSYDNGNIQTVASTDANGNASITINLNDNPTLKSVIFQDSGDNSLITLNKSGDRLSYTVTNTEGTAGTVQQIANLNDGYTLSGDNNPDTNPNGVKTILDNKTINITGGAKTSGDNAAVLADANNIGTSVSQDSKGNTTYTLKLNKDITGLNTVSAGGSTAAGDTAAVIGRQTVTKMTTNGTDSVDTNQTGDYVTGLDNKTWDGTHYVSGRGATEDQLKIVSDNIKNDVSTSDIYLQSAAVDYGTDGNATLKNVSMHGTTDTSKATQITGIHDYYVTSGKVENNILKLTRNNGEQVPDIDLSGIISNDTVLGGAPETTGTGENAKTTYTGKYSIDDTGNLDLNLVDARDNTKKVGTVTITGLAWKETVDKGVNYGTDTGHSTSTITQDGKTVTVDNWENGTTTNRQLGGTIGVFGGKTSTINGTTYTHDNIKTTYDANGNIVINLNDNPTLQSLILTNTGNTTDKITITKDTNNVDRLIVTPGATGSTPNTVAYTSDGLNFTGDNAGVTVKRALNSTLAVTGDPDAADKNADNTDHANIHVNADNTSGLKISLDDNVHADTFRAGNVSANKEGSVSIVGKAKDGLQEVKITSGYDTDNAHMPVAKNAGDNDNITRLQYTGGSGSNTHTVATLEDGYKLSADNGNDVNAGLNKTIKVTGGSNKAASLATADASKGDNIGVTISGDGNATYTLQLNQDLTGLHTVTTTYNTTSGTSSAVLGGQTVEYNRNGGGTGSESGLYVTGLTNRNWTVAKDAEGHITGGGSIVDGSNYYIINGRAATEDQLLALQNSLASTISDHENSKFGLKPDEGDAVQKTLGNDIDVKGAVKKDKLTNAATGVTTETDTIIYDKNGNPIKVKDADGKDTDVNQQVRNVVTSNQNGTIAIDLADHLNLGISSGSTGSINLYGTHESTTKDAKVVRINPDGDDGTLTGGVITITHKAGVNSQVDQKDGIRIQGPSDTYLNPDGTHSIQYDTNGSFSITNNLGQVTARLGDSFASGYLGLGNTLSTMQQVNPEQIRHLTTALGPNTRAVTSSDTPLYQDGLAQEKGNEQRDSYGQVIYQRYADGKPVYLTDKYGNLQYHDINVYGVTESAPIPAMTTTDAKVNDQGQRVDEYGQAVYRVDGNGNVLYQTDADGNILKTTMYQKNDGTWTRDANATGLSGKTAQVGTPLKDVTAGAIMFSHYGEKSLNNNVNTKGTVGSSTIDGDTMTRMAYWDEDQYDPSTTTVTGSVPHEIATLDDGIKLAGDTNSTANNRLNKTLTIRGAGATTTSRQSTSTNVYTRVYGNANNPNDGTAYVDIGLNRDIRGLSTIQVGGTDTNSELANNTDGTTIKIGNQSANEEATELLTDRNLSRTRTINPETGTTQGAYLYQAKNGDTTYYTSDTTDGNLQHDSNGKLISIANNYLPNNGSRPLYQAVKDGVTYYTTDAADENITSRNDDGTAAQAKVTLHATEGRYITGLQNNTWTRASGTIDTDRGATEGQLANLQDYVSQYHEEKTVDGVTTGGGYGVTAGDGTTIERNLGQAVTIRGDADVVASSGAWTGNIKTRADGKDTVTAFMNKDIRIGTDNDTNPNKMGVDDDGSLYVAGIKLGVLRTTTTTTTDPETGEEKTTTTTVRGADYGGNQGTNMASGTTGKTWSSENGMPAYMPSGNTDTANLNNAANIGDIYNIANQAITNVSNGHTQVTVNGGTSAPEIPDGQMVSTYTDGNLQLRRSTVTQQGSDVKRDVYDLKLSNNVTLGTDPVKDAQTGEVTTKGEAGSLKLKDDQGNTTVTVDGKTGSVTTGNTVMNNNGVTVNNGTTQTETNAGGVTISNIKTTTTANPDDPDNPITTTTTTEAVKLDNSGLAVKSDDGTKDVVKVDKSGLTVNDADGKEAVKVDNKGLKVTASQDDKDAGYSDIIINQRNVSMGGNQVTSVASGRSGKLWDTDTTKEGVKLPGRATSEDAKNLNNAANIGDIYDIANTTATTIVNENKLQNGRNITIDDNRKINLNNDVTLGTDPVKDENTGEVTTKGEAGSLKLKDDQGNTTVNIDGKAGSVTTGNTVMNNGGVTVNDGTTQTETKAGGITISNVTTTTDKETGKTTTTTTEAVKLDNKGLTVKASDADTKAGRSDISVEQDNVSMGGNQTKNLASGEGSLWGAENGTNQKKYGDGWTEEQQKNANNAANMGDVYKYMQEAKDDANGKHTAITVNEGTEAPDDKGTYSDASKGNLQLGMTTKDGKNTYDIKLSDQINIGEKAEPGKDGQPGKDGVDGKIGVNGKDGSAVVINGADGSIGLNGKDGANGVTIKGDKGSVGVDGTDGKDGKDGMTRITYTDSNDTKHEVATLDDGMKYGGDFGDEAAVKLDHKVNIKGGAKNQADLTDGNIGVVSSKADKDGNAILEVKLNKDLNLGATGSVTTGNTIMNTSGVTVKVSDADTKVGRSNITINQGNVSMGGNQVHNVASGISGEVIGDKDPRAIIRVNPDGSRTNITNNAVNVGDLNNTANNVINRVDNEINQVNNNINKLGTRVNRVGANAAALAALHPLDFDPDNKLDFSAGTGHYSGASAVALGAYYRPTEDIMISLGGSTGGGENMINAGVSFKLGNHNHVTNSRVAMAKEILAMQTKMDAMAKEIQTLKAGGAPAKVTPMGTSAINFPDVPENHWAYEYVKTLAQRGLVEGYPDGEYKGSRPMTRYEYAAIIYRALQKGAPVDGDMARSVNEFENEIADVQKAYRFRVDRVSGGDNDRNKIERVRVNDKDDPANNDYRDVYGSKIQKPAQQPAKASKDV